MAKQLSARLALPLVLVVVLAAACTNTPTATAPASPAPTMSLTAGTPTPVATTGPLPTIPEPTGTPAALFVPAGPFPANIVQELVIEADIPYTETVVCGADDCRVPLDALAPGDSNLSPTFVVIPGGPTDFPGRRYMAQLAAAIARAKGVVFLASYRNPATGSTDAESLSDIRCAIRFARSATANYGGDPDTLVLVGHSLGSTFAIRTAVNADAETPGCSVDGNGVPDAVVALSEFVPNVAGDADPALAPPILLLGGSLDELSAPGAETAENLVDAGYDAVYEELAGVNHSAMVDSSTPGVLDAIFEAALHVGPGYRQTAF